MVLSSGVRVVHYLSFLKSCTTRTPLLKTMGEFTDNMENKLTKHNTENSNNVSGVRVVHYLSFLCCV
jgi:hypothetical protein